MNPNQDPQYQPGAAPVYPDTVARWGEVNDVNHRMAVQHGWTGERPYYPPGVPPWAVESKKQSEIAVWALVTGCVGVLAGWCLLGLPNIAAVVLGHVGLAQTKDGTVSGRGMAVAGLVLGYVSLIPAVILFFWFVVGSATGGAESVTR